MLPLWTWEVGLRKALGLGQPGALTGWHQTGLFFGSSLRLFMVISNLGPSALEGLYSKKGAQGRGLCIYIHSNSAKRGHVCTGCLHRGKVECGFSELIECQLPAPPNWEVLKVAYSCSVTLILAPSHLLRPQPSLHHLESGCAHRCSPAQEGE